MKRKLLIAFIACTLSLIACKKDSQKSSTDNVLIRIENATAGNFSNLTLKGFHFGSIASGATTTYQRFEKVLPVPFANDIAINDQYLYIMEMYPIQFLQNGKYLMKMESDTVFRYKASFIKE